MGIAARLDDIGKPAWIGLMILSFIAFWPLGLAVLFFLIGSGRMGCWSRHHHWREKMERMCGGERRGRMNPPSSGNRAFDEYRAETLRRLEDEQREFQDFLERLRHAKDKAEFEQFMADRSRRPDDPVPQPQG